MLRASSIGSQYTVQKAVMVGLRETLSSALRSHALAWTAVCTAPAGLISL